MIKRVRPKRLRAHPVQRVFSQILNELAPEDVELVAEELEATDEVLSPVLMEMLREADRRLFAFPEAANGNRRSAA